MTTMPERRSSPGQRLPPIQTDEKPDSYAQGRHYGAAEISAVAGSSYYLEGLKHKLPPPKALKPHMDTYAGVVDSWPAHASGIVSTMQISLSKNKELVLADEEKMGKPQLTPKPKFLENLETFLKKELKALGVTTVEPNELRLQAHREVFEYLIEDFKTYKPLLASIKNEYEMMLAFQREEIRRLEPLKQMLVTVSEQCEQKIMKLRDEEKQEIVDLKRENARLYKAIDAMHGEQAALQTQVDRLQQRLSEQYEKYRDEADARKLLVSDINDLRYQQEDFLMQQAQQTSQDKADDPVLMKIALKKARESEKDATQRLNEMIANYGDVIPRREFEALEKHHLELKEKMEIRDKDFNILRAEHDTLLEVQRQVVMQRDEFYQEAARLRENATPRPTWTKCADYVHGGAQRWLELSQGKSSKDLLSILISELSGGAVGSQEGSSDEYFEGQGIGEIVPIYLRCEGQVRNRRLAKRDTALVVKDVWKERAVAQSELVAGSKLNDMTDFFYEYLTRRFPIHHMAIEWAYNIHEACQRFALDDRLALFFGIITGEVQEETYSSQLQVMGQLLRYLKKKSDEAGGSDKLSKPAMQTALAEFFINKSESDVRELVKAAEEELDATDIDMIEFSNLFLEDDEGKFGQFVDELLRQLQEDKSWLINDIKTALGDVSQIGSEDLRQAVMSVGHNTDQHYIDGLLCWTFRVKDTETLSSALPLDVETAIHRLSGASLPRPMLRF